jgi:hypothetical protein
MLKKRIAPPRRPRQHLGRFVGRAVLAALLNAPAISFSQNSEQNSLAPLPTTALNGPDKPPIATCMDDCIRDNSGRAVESCAPRIEDEAPGDFEWLLRPYGTIFQEASRPEANSSVIQYRGDSIRFQNAQREWVRVSYACGYDAAQQAVAYVRVRPGRLNQPQKPPPSAGVGSAQQVAPATAPQNPAKINTVQAASSPAQPAGSTSSKLKIGEPSDTEVRQVRPKPGSVQ